MTLTYHQAVGMALISVVVMVHLVFLPVIEIILFRNSKDLQKMYLRGNFGGLEAFETVKFILLNLGFYNVLCGLAIMYAAYVESIDLLRPLLWICIGNGVVILYQSMENYFGAVARGIPAVVALSYLQFLPTTVEKPVAMPWYVVLVPVVFHIVFFVLESLLFPSSKFVQKMFIGRAARSPMAVDAAREFLFCQGFFNLFIACATAYSLVVTQSLIAVKCFMIIIVGASLVLAISAPKLYQGAIIQGGPALGALHALFNLI